ncbi:MAG: hypothetical protein ACOCYB_10505 [Alkalispirochaeta sp.]
MLEVIAEAVRDIIELNLRVIGDYDIVAVGPTAEEGTPDPNALAAAANLDAVVCGTVTRDSSGRVLFELLLYERESPSSRLVAEAAADSVFDVFEVGDRIALEFLSEIGGRQIAYGSLLLRNDGVQRPFRVLRNGEAVGQSLGEILRLIVSEYELVIETEGITGVETIVSQTVSVSDGRTTVVGFEVPGLVDGPAQLARIDRAILTDWAPNPENAQALFLRVLDGLAELPGAPELQNAYESWQRRSR